jgi:hypothetical protein
MVDNIHASLESSQLACTMIICGHVPSYTPSVVLQKEISGTTGITLTRLQGLHQITPNEYTEFSSVSSFCLYNSLVLW